MYSFKYMYNGTVTVSYLDMLSYDSYIACIVYVLMFIYC